MKLCGESMRRGAADGNGGDDMGKTVYTTLDTALTGRKIKGIITGNGYSVRELQAMLNLSCPQPIYRWMNGQTLPSIDNLYMLHRILGVHMEDMLVAKDGADIGEGGMEKI